VHGVQKVLSNKLSFRKMLPNGKLLLLSLTKCHGVPCTLPSRITTKVLKNCKTFSSRPRPRPNVQDQDFMIQDQDFRFCSRGASRPRPWSRGLHHCFSSRIILDKHVSKLPKVLTFKIFFFFYKNVFEPCGKN